MIDNNLGKYAGNTTVTSPHMKYPLRHVDVPEGSSYWPSLNAVMYTGEQTVYTQVESILSRAPQRVSADIETAGTDAGRWTIKCITVAYREMDGMVATLLLDPLRKPNEGVWFTLLMKHCSRVVFHNAMFDIPPLFWHGLIDMDIINKVDDTLILARMLHTNNHAYGRRLEDLAVRYKLASDNKMSIGQLMLANGYKKISEGYLHADIDQDFYRRGAMSDTAVTLRLWDELHNAVGWQMTKGGGNGNPLARLDYTGSCGLMENLQRVNRVALRQATRGFKVDNDYIDKWFSDTEDMIEKNISIQKSLGIRPGVGDDVVKYLNEEGILPSTWEKTEKTGKLKSDKKALENLAKTVDHPSLLAHEQIAQHNKIADYFFSVRENAVGTSRCHPTINILGGAATGRMSLSNPALQQFPDVARRCLLADSGDFWSADWSSIEPVILGNCAGDTAFISPYNAGGDLYIPLARDVGLIPPSVSDKEAKSHKGRFLAKRIQLASMYGQGIKSLAAELGITEDAARDIQSRIRHTMQTTYRFMDNIRNTCRRTGTTRTISGRMLDERDYTGKVTDFIAVNHFCQGSSADILMATTLALDDLGLADGIKLWIHDELVVSEDIIDDVKEVMARPPQWLLDATESTPILRVDAENLGPTWTKPD